MDTCADDANGKAPSDADAERQKKLESLLGKLPDGGTINSEDEDGDVEITDKDNIREFRKTSGKKVNEDDAHDGSIIGFSPQGKDYDEDPGLSVKHDDGQTVLIRTAHELGEDVLNHPDTWYIGIQGLLLERNNALEEFEEGQKTIFELRKEAKETEDTLIQEEENRQFLLDETKKALTNVSRLRIARDRWYKKAQELDQENNNLKEEIARIKKAERIRANSVDSFDSPPTRSCRTRSPIRTDRTHVSDPRRRSRSPTLTLTKITDRSINKRYPDPPVFSGEDTTVEEYRGWKLHVYAKIRHSAGEFPTEQAKIDYVRDRCKKAAFDAIYERSDLANDHPYLSLDEMFEDLDHEFMEENERDLCDMKIHDPNFQMGVYKKDETLEEFIKRFRRTIRPLKMDEYQKINAFNRNMSSRLQSKFEDGSTYKTLAEFLTKVKRADLQMQAHGKGTSAKHDKDGKDDKKGKSKEGPKGKGKTLSGPRRPPEVFKRLAKEGICIKCGVKGHTSRDKDAPCKNSVALTDAEIIAKLSALFYNQETPSNMLALTSTSHSGN